MKTRPSASLVRFLLAAALLPIVIPDGEAQTTSGPTVAFDSATYSVAFTASGSAKATITVALKDGPANQAVDFTYGTVGGGTGVAGVDFTTINNASGTIPAGAASTTFDVQVFNNPAGGSKTVNLSITGVTGPANPGNPTDAVLTIYSTPVSLALSSTTYTQNADPSGPVFAPIQVNLTGGFVGDTVTFNYMTVDLGPASDAAVPGVDYVPTSGTGSITVGAGPASSTFNVRVLNNPAGGPKRVGVQISVVTPGPATLGSPSTATLTITSTTASPYRLQLNVPSTMFVDEEVEITASLTFNGSPVPGHRIAWSVAPGTIASVQPASSITDGAGQARTTLKAKQTGTATVTAQDQTVLLAKDDKKVEVVPDFTLTAAAKQPKPDLLSVSPVVRTSANQSPESLLRFADAEFSIALFQKVKNVETPPADGEVDSQTYTISIPRAESGKIYSIRIDNGKPVTQDTQTGPDGFAVAFKDQGQTVVLTKSKKGNAKARFTLTAAVYYTATGPKTVTVNAEVKVKGVKAPLTAPAGKDPVKFMVIRLQITPLSDTGRALMVKAKTKTLTPINSVRNPAGILILDKKAKKGDFAVTADTVPQVSLTVIEPKAFKDTVTEDDARLVWKILSTDRDGTPDGKQAPAEFFTADDGKLADHGTLVKLYGLAGSDMRRIRVTVSIRGREGPNDWCEYYEAVVVEPRSYPYRVQLLRFNDTVKSVFADDPGAFQFNIDAANRVLRQVGVTLVPDRSGVAKKLLQGYKAVAATLKDGTEIPGMFVVTVPKASDIVNVDEDKEKELVAVNAVPKVVNFCCIVSPKGNAYIGNTPSRPGHRPAKEEVIDLTYRILKAVPPKLEHMKLFPEKLITENKDTWGIFLPNAIANEVRFYILLSHEVGHSMNLRHRVVGDGTDGLLFPKEGNVMASPKGGNPITHGDFDLPQVYGARGSPILLKKK